MDLASLRAISVRLFMVVITALDSTPCHMPRAYTGALGRLQFMESGAYKAKGPLGILDISTVLYPRARAAIC